MNCLECNKQAIFKCACDAEPYMCPAHLVGHINGGGNHPIEYMDFVLEPERLKDLKSLILSRIEKINKAKNDILKTSISVIAEIKKSTENAISKLNTLKNSWSVFLKSEKFFKSDLPKIEDFESKFVVIKMIKLDDIICDLRKCYEKDLVTFMDYQALEDNFLNHYCTCLLCGAVTGDHTTLLVGDDQGKVRGFDLIQKKQIFVLHGHFSKVWCIVLTGDSLHAISGSYDASVRIWNIKERKQVAVLKGHKANITSLCYIEARSLIISGSIDQCLIVWDIINFTIVKKLDISEFIISTVLFENQSKIIIGSEKNIIFYNIETEKVIKTIEAHTNVVSSLLLTRDEKILVSGSYDMTIAVWDLCLYQKKFNCNIDFRCNTTSIILTLDEKSILLAGINIIRAFSILT